MQSRSLAARLFILTALWAVFATALIAWFISQGFRTSVEENLSQRLTANLYNIMGSVSPRENGQLTGNPDLRDSRYLTFRSGYYWTVTNVADQNQRLASQSLGGERLEIEGERNFDQDFQRTFRARDAAGNELLGIEAQAFLGEGDSLYAFRISGNLSEVDQQVETFTQRLLLVLGLFALGFVLVTYFIVRLGLAPIGDATARLSEIRDGRADKLEGNFPREIQPLIDETNALISSNKTVIERARTQVGNLAHSLKTPLAVLRNEGARARPELQTIIEEQVQLMQGQIQAYLDRARISARAGTITSRTDIIPVTERLVRVMQKLNPAITISLKREGTDAFRFAGEQQDFEEMVGNLLENACKFARDRIDVTLNLDKSNLLVSIEDDGVGMSEEEAAKALQRGTRLDETKPGSGLGLSIVRDIASEYGGTLTLGRSAIGGLAAHLFLPATAKRNG